MIRRRMARCLWLLVVLAAVGAPRQARAAVRGDGAFSQADGEPAGVQVDQAHVFIVPAEDRIQVAEYYLIGNSTQETFVGASGEDADVVTTIAFELSADATRLVFEGDGLGQRYVGDERRFADTLPIPPGTATVEVGFSYELPIGEEVELARSLDVPVASLVLIVSGQSTGLEGRGLTFTGELDTRMGVAASYLAGPLEAGELLAVRLVSREATGMTSPMTGGSATAMRPRARNVGGEIAVGVSALVVAGIAAYWTLSSRSRPRMPESIRPIIEEIAALDARYELGQLEAGPYHRERDALMREVRRATRSGG